MASINTNGFIPPRIGFGKIPGKGGKMPGVSSNFGPGKLRGVGKPSLGANQSKLNQIREMAGRQVAPLDLKSMPGGEAEIKKAVRKNINKEDSEKTTSLEKTPSDPELPKFEKSDEKMGWRLAFRALLREHHPPLRVIGPS